MLISITSGAQGFLKADGKSIRNASGKEIILRGMGLGGWMLQEPYMMQLSEIAKNQREIKAKVKLLVGEKNTEVFYNAWLANHCTKADVDSLAAWGFNSIRLPMHFNLFTLPVDREPVAGENTWLTKGFELTDSLLSWCKENKIYLILDLHAAPGGQGNDLAISDRDGEVLSLWQSEANQQKTVALWEKLATRYANEEWIAGYDLINEPNWGFQNASDKNGCAETQNKPLKKLYQEITAAIRKVDQRHIIFIEGNCWANNFEGMFPLWDKNIVISFHKYWNSTGTASIQKFLNYRTKYNVPVWMGETGENSNSWMTNAIELFERNKISWALWPLKKSGLNNPLQVKISPGYQKVLDYWKSVGAKPSPSQAYTGLMEYAKNTRAQNNVVHRDMIDAITRQVRSSKTEPFKTFTVTDRSILYAADYDLGRSGFAYHDVDSATYWVDDKKHNEWNSGKQYRNDGVDIEQCRDTTSNGFSVGWIQDGEWLQYTVYSPEGGTFDINVRTAAAQPIGKIQLLLNGKPKARLDISGNGDYNKWTTSTMRNISLIKGWNQLRVLAVKGGFNLNYLQFIQINSTAKNN